MARRVEQEKPILLCVFKAQLMVMAVMVLFLPMAAGQFDPVGVITPPPQIGDKPIVANGIVYYLKTVPDHCMNPYVTRYPTGGVVQGRRALMKSDNPHRIYGNIEIPPDACLYIEPGTIMRFGPGFGIIVNGTLIARGSEEPGGRIVMTKDAGLDTGAPSGDWRTDARLSNGNTTQDGQLQLLYLGKWRSMCTNYQNFTLSDVNVTCRHLGFLKGNFTYNSFARNLTSHMLWEQPSCNGSENSLFDCPGAKAIKVGAHICDGQQVVGIECEGLRPGLAMDHWRGIEFFNASNYLRLFDDNVYMADTYSWLEYLDILYPGLDTFHGRTQEPNIFYPKAAISASPNVPLMNNVTIMYGAYDGFNLTDITGFVHIANCTIHKNRGHGIFIKSAVGQTLVNMTQVTDNWGDGIKFYISNLTIHDFQKNFTWERGFCNTPSSGSQVYPVFEHQDIIGPNGENKYNTYCSRTYTTTKQKSVNLHFMILERDPEATGKITVFDGGFTGTQIGEYPVTNGSFPQSIRSRTSTLYFKFDYTLPRLDGSGKCRTFAPCLRILLRVTTTNGTEDDFRMIYSRVSGNIGHGVNIQDMRSKVYLNTSEVYDNNFGAGVRIYQGAGEVIINNTLIQNNADAGINITYSGGYMILNNTNLSRNRGYGVITEFLKLNRTRIEYMYKMEVVRSLFMYNELIGLRVGNYCLGGSVLVNESTFSYNWDEAIEYLSCNITTFQPTNFSVAFSTFENNTRHAILMRPLLNTVGIITNCTFSKHSLGALRIDNGFDLLISKWYKNFPVNYSIFENKFQENTGRYAVSLRLTEGTPRQILYFKFNKLTKNYINDSFMYVNPRSQANGVAVVSSSNILFMRNSLSNPQSVREVSTHLTDPSIDINATENYWAIEVIRQSDFEKIHMSIFDQDDRYNLAQVQYYPVLKTDQVYENVLTTNVPKYAWSFSRPQNVIGGLLERNDFIGSSDQTYYVDRDIYVFPGQVMTLHPRVTLLFATTVGMVVHGILIADGQNSNGKIKFGLWNDPDILPLENRTATVRLMDGADLYEGRLEVLIDDEWGTVCDEGWIEENAALVCLQLGLIYTQDQGTPSKRIVAPLGTQVLLSWVWCEEEDYDLTKCHAVRGNEVSCDHGRDVYLRCQDPTWAGLTLPATAKLGQSREHQLREVHLERAGLFDAESMSFTPALRIDYNFYQITAITIINSLSDGVHINYIHPYETSRLEYMQIHNNLGYGVVTRYPRLELFHSNVTHNIKAGFLYNPFFSEYEALLVRGMIHETRRSLLTETPSLPVGNGQMTFLICPPGETTESKDYYTQVTVSRSTYRVVLQVLDFDPDTGNEEVIVYNSDRINIGSNTKLWRIPQDLVDFPVVSTTTTLTIMLRVHGLRSGRLAFAVLSQEALSGLPVMKTYVYNTTFSDNYQGIQTKHYNSPSNRRMEIFHRFKQETLTFYQVNVLNSKQEAMHMPSVTKFTDDYIPTYEDMTTPERVATISYNISFAKFADNEVGILAEHNHVDFANNVWQWFISNARMERTKNGGVEIEVPRVNSEEDRLRHSLSVTESVFRDNLNFAFSVTGYYSNVKIENNQFDNNRCLLGLLTVSGMEKNLSVISNRITNNIGRHMINIEILSHSEYSDTVVGVMRRNDINSNRYEGLNLPGYGNNPTTFAVAFKGVQPMVANRNLFNNPMLGYELVAGVTALTLGNTLNVTENFWGRVDYTGILERIFDFDDWNNYAIANFFPFLTRGSFDSDISGGQPVKPPLDTNRLGGRVSENQILAYKPEPYIVERDLTIMPDVTLTISPGTELQFYPNVGILVLGRLLSRGLEYNRIKFRPVESSNNLYTSGRKKRFAAATIRLRGDGTLFKDAGFLELYNTSTKTWNMMCDNLFNEKSAEVVCRQLGKETINVRVRFTHLYDHYIHGKPQFFLKEFWFQSYFCRGDEISLNQCNVRYNYNLQQCIRDANYTFIVCGERNLRQGNEYWGNIRFASKTFQEEPLQEDIGKLESIMEYVDIEGAGMLHGDKIGAIQTTYVTPIFRFLNITNCADNGFDIIAPRGILEMNRINVSNNLGFGYNFLILNGESSDRDSSFMLLGTSTIPYYVYGLVEMCRMEKDITLQTRMIVYYKYGPDNRDCVKVVHSSNPRYRIGLRFLQINMFHEDFSRNSIEIFEGNRGMLIAEIVANTSRSSVLQLYESSGDTLSIHLHASISHGSYGFIAEVVVLPLSGLTYPDSNYRHSITNSIAVRNQDGALQYKNVGEINPSFFMDKCWLENNGVPILNLTSPPSIDISLQGTLLFRFDSNFVSRNKGGMYLYLHTNTIATALRGNVTNNIFSFGTNGEALNISGHYYQRLYMFQNYIYNYTTGDYRDVVHIRDVVVNYTFNYLDGNTGHYILTAYNSDNQQARQEYTKSGFTNNNSTALIESTIKIGSGQPFFENNYIYNEENDFELETYPKLDPGDGAIDARLNWWGSELRSFISGKIWDETDKNNLVRVEFWQPKLDNRTVVEGKCAPGWKQDSGRCYRFMGGALPYYEANNFCKSMGAFLAEAKGREGFYNYLLRLMRNMNNPADRVWVLSDVGSGRCSAFENTYIIYEEDCWNLLYPFICEQDPYIEPTPGLENAVRAMIIGISAGIGGVLILVFLILGILFCVKSKRREQERFERTASIRSSMRNSVHASKSTLTMLSEGRSRQRLNELEQYSQASSGTTKNSQRGEDMNGSMASLHSGYRNGHAVAVDRRGAPRLGVWERERTRERGPRYRNDEEGSNAGRLEKDNSSESEDDKKEFSDDSEEENETISDEEEETPQTEQRVYENNKRPAPLQTLAGVRLTRSRDDLYENGASDASSQKAPSLSSFSQPESPNESPVKSIFIPRRKDLPTPPPTPQSASPKQSQQDLQNRLGPGLLPGLRLPERSEPNSIVHQYRQSPVPSERSQISSSGRPTTQPRKQLGFDQRPVPPKKGPSSIQEERDASPLPTKSLLGSDSYSSSLPDEPGQGYRYRMPAPPGQTVQHVPNLPQYNSAVRMDIPPSYEESDRYPEYSYSSPYPTGPAESDPDQDVHYLPRQQLDRRPVHGSRGQLANQPVNLTGSRERLLSSPERLDSAGALAPQKSDILYLIGSDRGGQARKNAIETEI